MSQDISSILSTNNGTANPLSISDSRSNLDKNQFLQLLLAQLKNQDPLSPSADPSEFTKQMTQFSQLEQLFNLNDGMRSLGEEQGRMARSEAVSMIGKQVEAKNNLIEVREGRPTQIGFSLSEPASSVRVEVLDSLGRVVRTVDYRDQAAGSHFNDFDGLDNRGGNLSGVYSLRVTARSNQGTAIASQAILRNTVTGVDYSSGTPMLRVGNRSIRIEDVLSINQVS